MIVLTFQPRFRAMVLSGAKANTIRADRKRPVKVGDVLSLRGWSGRPYASKQVVVLDNQRCIRTCPVVVGDHYIEVDGHRCDDAATLYFFAVRDGFNGWADLIAYFREQGPLPFVGTLIGWAAAASTPIASSDTDEIEAIS